VTEHVVFLLLGLANGAVYASLALALVVTFRSSGVVNFATGAIALFTAYLYAFLRQGQLLLFLPGLPQSIDLPGELSFVPAAAISVAAAALLGLALYGLTFRPLRRASPIAKAVASVGVMTVITGAILQSLGTAPVVVGSIFPTSVYTIGSVRVSADRLWFAGTVVAVTGLLWMAFRFTRFGLHTRAAAETEKGAYVSRISPDRIAALNWMISAAVAGLAGILIAPISPLVPYSYTLFVVPALAAAILGRFTNMGAAVAAGLAIGMLQSEITYVQNQHSWLPSSGLPELVPLILILVVLVLRAKPLPSRGAILQPRLGRAPRPGRLLKPAVAGAALAVAGIVLLQGSWRAALVTSFIFGIVSLSIVVVTGYAGQISLAQLTLAGVAGFLLSPLTTTWHIPFPLAPVLAALGATVIGVVVGLPALRVRGLPLAIVTLSLAVSVQALWFRNVDLVGSSGKSIGNPTLFGVDLGPGTGGDFPRPQFCFLVLGVLVVVAVAVAMLRKSSLGSAMLAVRANERSAAASGINVLSTKLVAFAIAAFIAGIGGSMLAYNLRTVTFDSFDVLLGLGVFATVYLAGITSVSGGLLAGVIGIGGLFFYASTQWLSFDAYTYQTITGIGLVLTVILNPEGIVGPAHQAIRRRRERRRRTYVAPIRQSLAPAGPAVAHGAAGSDASLSVRSLTIRYGGVLAVDDVSFDIRAGAITGLIGPNGAGKTTLVDAISGFCAYSGSVRLEDAILDDLPPYRRIRAGLGRTFQGIELWNDLTVAENVVVGYRAGRQDAARIDHIFELLRLGELREQHAGELSQGQRQLVSIARALVARPAMLLLDEPAAGLDSAASAWLGERLRDIRDAGTTILLIDHDMGLVLNLCDQIEVVDCGRLIASGAPQTIRADAMVMDAYLGNQHETPQMSAR
jgi:ABC-type branched-subunit amino acid transport system ATPase component/branched-subunit amino acid ABC-type transport system permease component